MGQEVWSRREDSGPRRNRAIDVYETRCAASDYGKGLVGLSPCESDSIYMLRLRWRTHVDLALLRVAQLLEEHPGIGVGTRAFNSDWGRT